MIIYFSDGQLGNNLFQFAFLASYAGKNEKIIVWGFEFLTSLFDVKDKRFFIFFEDKITKYIPENLYNLKIFLKYKILKNRIRYGIVRKTFESLAKNKIISYVSLKKEKICDNTYSEIPEVVFSKGLIHSIKYVGRYFFQSEKLFNREVLYNLEFKQEYVDEAEKFIQKYQNFYRFAVHIRLGDYKKFCVCNESPVLPFDYFHKQIKWFLENKQNPFFIFLSDEPDEIKSEFHYIKDRMVISENPWQVDFLIITMCNGAIISPSSFAWWACYFMKNRDVVFAPKYWLGFKIKKEYNQGSFPSFAVSCEV